MVPVPAPTPVEGHGRTGSTRWHLALNYYYYYQPYKSIFPLVLLDYQSVS